MYALDIVRDAAVSYSACTTGYDRCVCHIRIRRVVDDATNIASASQTVRFVQEDKVERVGQAAMNGGRLSADDRQRHEELHAVDNEGHKDLERERVGAGTMYAIAGKVLGGAIAVGGAVFTLIKSL